MAAKPKVEKPVLVECKAIDNWHNIELHEYCSMFPEASDEDYEALVNSMKDRGFMPDQPLVVIAKRGSLPTGVSYEEEFLLLDGRNRHTACMDAKATPKFMEYVGDDPMGFVLARNLDRRHLSAGQKAALALKLANMEVGDNRKEDGKISQKDAADLVNSNTTNMAKLKRVQEADPKLAEQVELGHVALDKAYQQVTKPEAGEGKGQKPGEAKQSADTAAKTLVGGTKDTGVAKGNDVDPDEKTGSLNMDFEKQSKVKRVFKSQVDRGPWESGNPAEDAYHQKNPIILVGLGPQSFRLSVEEAKKLVTALNNSIDKMLND